MLPPPIGIDQELLRSFVFTAECGSLALGAYRMGCAPTLVSAHLRRLEELLGQQLMTRRNRGVVLTPHGAWLLARARPLLAAQDSILAAFRRPRLTGVVRFGVTDDYLQPWLPRILVACAAAAPDVTVETLSAPPERLAAQVAAGELDLALICAPGGAGDAEGEETPLWRGPLTWLGPLTQEAHCRPMLPLALGQPDCLWRRAATAALDARCLPWRIAAATTSATGALPVVRAGLAVTVGLPVGLPAGLRELGPAEGLPRLPELSVRALTGSDRAAVLALRRQVEVIFGRSAAADLDSDVYLGHAA